MKKLLIIVDYQNDFVSGSLGNPFASAIEGAVVEKIKQYRENGDEIAFTFDTHDDQYMQTQEGKHLPVPHCQKGSSGWQLFGKVAALIQPEDQRFCKSCFGSADMFDFLRHKTYESVELAGVVTNICVLSNAVLVKTALPETTVLVDAAATASNDPDLHQKALDILESIHVTVINKRREEHK